MGNAVKKDILKRLAKPEKKTTIKQDPAIDLILAGKQLGFDGLQPISEALVLTISAGSIHLEELNLSECDLTAECLPLLTAVVRLSPEIKDIDLSKNNISLDTDEHCWKWKAFLESFSGCRALRRLDLSGNSLGDKAIELLIQAYAFETPITLPGARIKPERDDDSFEEDDSPNLEEQLAENLKITKRRLTKGELEAPSPSVSRSDSLTSNTSLFSTPSKTSSLLSNNGSPISDDGSPNTTTSTHLGNSECKGLRAIPYLILSNTGITDLSALWLSFMIPIHPKPWQLLSAHAILTKEPVKNVLLERYHTNRDCKGIMWLPNQSLTVLGLKALCLAEHIRGWAAGDEDCFSASKTLRMTDVKRRGSETGHASNIWLYDIYGAPTRNQVALQDLANPQPVYTLSAVELNNSTAEMDRSRLKLEGTALRDSGSSSGMLWKTTLRMLVVSRCFLFGYKDVLVLDGVEASGDVWDAVPSLLAFRPGRCGSLDALTDHTDENHNSHLPTILDGCELQASSGANSGYGFLPLPSNARRTSTSKRDDKFHWNKATPESPCPPRTKARALSNSSTTSKKSLSTQPTPKPSPKLNGKYTDPVVTASLMDNATIYLNKNNTKADSKLPGKLPSNIWMKIISIAEDPHDLTTPQQRLGVFNFARSPATLAMERDIIGKLPSFQIRRVLESVKAIVYEVET